MIGLLVALVVILTGVTAAWQGFLPWRAHRFEETRQTLTGIRVILQDDVAKGGTSTRHYLTPEAQDLGGRLGDLRDEPRSRSVRSACIAVLDYYNKAFASAPPPQYVVNLNAPVDPIRYENLPGRSTPPTTDSSRSRRH